MLTNAELAAALQAHGFRLLVKHDDCDARPDPWCYLLGDWGLNYGVGRDCWDQVSFTTARYAAARTGQPGMPPVGTITLYHGHFTDPGTKTEQVAGGTLVSDSFANTEYDGNAPGVLEALVAHIVKLVQHAPAPKPTPAPEKPAMPPAETMTQELAVVFQIPKVEFWATLVAGLAMAGFRVVPLDTWGIITAAIRKLDPDAYFEDHKDEPGWVDDSDEPLLGKALQQVGFTVHENHVRGQDHESWQTEMAADEHKLARERGVPCWVLPYDELDALADCTDTKRGEFEGVSITRYVFVGTEDELRGALAVALA